MSNVISGIIEELTRQIGSLEKGQHDGETFRELIALVEPDVKITIGHDDRAGYAVKVGRENYYALSLPAAISIAIRTEKGKRDAKAQN